MVLSYQFNVSAYGFCLPSDLCGSCADTGYNFELLHFGLAIDTAHLNANVVLELH